MKRVILSILLLVFFSFTSCKSTSASLQRATATSIGNTLSSEVTVSNIKRRASNVSWDAKKGNDYYKCEADDMVRRVNCKKVKDND